MSGRPAALADYESEVQRLRAYIRASPVPARPSSARRIISSDRADAFITLKGVDPVLEGQVTDLERTVKTGQSLRLWLTR